MILFWPPEVEESDADRLFGWYNAKNSKLTVHIKPGDNAIPTFKLPAVSGPPPVSEGVPGRN